MNIRERIINLRYENNLSQQEFSEMLNVSRTTVARWESGKSSPSAAQIANVCNVFHLDSNEFYSLSPNESSASEKKPLNKKFLASVIVLGVFIVAALIGLIVTIVYAVKDASYDASATVWVISIPANTPMIVLSVFLAAFILILTVLIVYIFRRNKEE